MKFATKAAEVHGQVSHPIIDADGHLVELGPVLDDELLSYLEEAGGPRLRDRYLAGTAKPFDTSTALANRDHPAVREKWLAMPSWWGWQTRNTLDRATAHLPRLLYERLDEMGIDFTLLYPSAVLALVDLDDVELGAALARGANRWLARIFKPFQDRIAVGGIVPMNNPQTAIAELEYAVTQLGLKTVVVTGYARRMLGDRRDGSQGFRLDTFGLDSEYDYDPFWAKCVELGVAPLSHSSHLHTRVARSVSNYVYNHIGALATSHESLAKSLFLGGVTRRFPTLRFGFLEGGVAWACSLYAELLGHWSKRNSETILDLDPDRLDVDELMKYVEKYGDDAVRARPDRIRQFFSRPAARPGMLDEFSRAMIRKAEDIRDRFVPNFYFGCEADDPLYDDGVGSGGVSGVDLHLFGIGAKQHGAQGFRVVLRHEWPPLDDLEEPKTPFPPREHERARQTVKSFLGSIAPKADRPLIFVRVQPPSTGQTLKDLRAAMGERLAGILVPKVQSPADIHAADALLTCMEVDLGLPMGTTMIYPILETAPALRLAYEIAIASPRVSYMGGAISRFGDIHQAVGYRWTQEGRETLFIRSKVLLDAKAAGIRYPISGMWGGDLDDEQGLRAWCKELRDLGYYGMMIGNPRLVPIVHEHFTPSPTEIAYWKDLDRLAAEAEKNGSGPIIYGDPNRGEGHRVHLAHVGSARKNLLWAKELGVA